MSIEKEKKVLKKMITIYCQGKHKSTENLCNECSKLITYSFQKLNLCPFKENKPSCKKCPIHCYSPKMRERIKDVMKYSGPRMIFYTPTEWLKHKIEELFNK